MSDVDFISFVDSMDRCWMEGRFQDLGAFFAEDVVFVAPGGKHRSVGLAPAIESYRQFLSRAQVTRFQTQDHVVTQRGDAAIVEYAWQMTWVVEGAEHTETGREVLALTRRDGNWRVIWRTQIPTGGG